jgi:1-phosphofructokinase family hexose kinase
MIYTLTLNPSLDREMTVPAIALDQVLRASVVRVDYGGKGLNVSRALVALGVESTALGFVGGTTGETLRSGLANLGLHTDFVQVSGETRTNTSVVTQDHRHYLKVNAPGPEIASFEQSALMNMIANLAKQGDWWVLAGSLPPGVPLTYYAGIIQTVQSQGARAILDTEGEPLRLGCGAMPFLVKPNANEASELAGLPITSPDEAYQAASAIHALGAQNVVISLGPKGAVHFDGHSAWLAEPPAIEEHNPIGAGDALVAGLAWGYGNGYSTQDILRWGNACGAAAASLDGTGMGTREQVQELLAQVRVIPIGTSTLDEKR